MAQNDFIPPEDAAFDVFLREVFAPYVNIHFLELGMTAAENTAFQALVTAWGYAWPAFNNARAAFRAATEDKDVKRHDAEEGVRGLNARFQINSAIPPSVIDLLGLTVRKLTRTPSPVPATTPLMQRIDTSTRGILRLFYADSATPDSRKKPGGVQFCEIRQLVVAPGGAAPSDPEAMPVLAQEGRAPYRADFDADEVGHTAYFALRWISTRGDAGPFSAIYSAVVPS